MFIICRCRLSTIHRRLVRQIVSIVDLNIYEGRKHAAESRAPHENDDSAVSLLATSLGLSLDAHMPRFPLEAAQRRLWHDEHTHTSTARVYEQPQRRGRHPSTAHDHLGDNLGSVGI
jgi:hypothetical protein